jgi:hypothetical protein
LLAANKTNFIGGSRLLLYKGNVFLNIYGNNSWRCLMGSWIMLSIR